MKNRRSFWKSRQLPVSNASGTQLEASCATQFLCSQRWPLPDGRGTAVVSPLTAWSIAQALLLSVCFGCFPLIATGSDVLTSRSAISAVERGVRILEKAARNYPEHRDCFACHHQTLPLLAMREARAAGVSVDESVFRDTLDFVRKFFAARTSKMSEGENIPGRALMVAYGAFSFEVADVVPPTDVAQAMAKYVVWRQERDGRWKPSAIRPPSEQSEVSNTVLALRTLRALESADAEWSVTAAESKRRGLEWLAGQDCRLQEDLAFRLWSFQWFGDEGAQRGEFVRRIAMHQRDDGGWAAESGLKSEAYSTGLTLFALLETGEPFDSLMIRRAAEYLLASQQGDGSWLVETRAKPVQVFFDNGDPHGKSQFISITATGWSTAALARWAKLEKTQARKVSP